MKMVRSVLARRGIDVTRADVRVQKGLCSIRGFVQAAPGARIPNIESEMELVAKILRQKAEIRSVILEITIKG